MSPEYRTSSTLGPRAKSRFKRVAGLASAALVVAIGLVTPAAAHTRGMTTHVGAPDADYCGKDRKDKCKKPTPPPLPPTGCFDIDSTVQDPDKFIAVVCNGRVYVLTVRETPPSGPPTPINPPGWKFVGGPTNVVDVTLASRANVVYVSVLTATGRVYQGICGATEPIGTCTFYSLPTPP
ncbi:hypothetical protein ACWEOV_41785 [Streptomyces sp. NPDC004365]